MPAGDRIERLNQEDPVPATLICLRHVR